MKPGSACSVSAVDESVNAWITEPVRDKPSKSGVVYWIWLKKPANRYPTPMRPRLELPPPRTAAEPTPLRVMSLAMASDPKTPNMRPTLKVPMPLPKKTKLWRRDAPWLLKSVVSEKPSPPRMPDQISPVPPRVQPSFTVDAETPKWPTPRPFWMPERLPTFDGVWQANPPCTVTLPWLQNASCS